MQVREMEAVKDRLIKALRQCRRGVTFTSDLSIYSRFLTSKRRSTQPVPFNYYTTYSTRKRERNKRTQTNFVLNLLTGRVICRRRHCFLFVCCFEFLLLLLIRFFKHHHHHHCLIQSIRTLVPSFVEKKEKTHL